MKQVRLRKGKEESLKRFHPWVFSGAIATIDEGIAEGEVVRVVTNSGDFIAVGHYQEGSIAVRVLTFSDVQIDDEFWHSRLASALKMRQAIGIADNPNNNTYRLVHGEGDNLPGLIIDVYGETAVMQAHSIGMHLCRKEIARALNKVMEGRVKHIYYKSETTLPFMTADDMNCFLVGGSDDNIATENGLKFRVRERSEVPRRLAERSEDRFLCGPARESFVAGEVLEGKTCTEYVLLYGWFLVLCHAWRC